jgi:uncharacterized protein
MSEANDTVKRRVPNPPMTEETVPFWDATAEGKLLLKRCTDCSEFHWYPRTKCPFCHSLNTNWVESAGTGVIYSYSVMRRAQPNYALVYVTLDEGVTMMSNLVDCDFDALAIGQRVKVKFEDAGSGCAVPYFTPA